MDLKELRKFANKFSSLSDQALAHLRDMPEVIVLTQDEFDGIKNCLGDEDRKYWIGPGPLIQRGSIWVWENPYYGASTSEDTGTGSNPVGT